MKYFLITFLGFLFMAANTQAQDAGLYDPMAAPDSAFIRLINVRDANAARPLKLNGKILDAAALGQATAYFATKDGLTRIAVDNKKLEKSTVRKRFYTVADSKNGLVFIEDKAVPKDKAQITLYNFSPKNGLVLKTLDGKTAIAGPVSTGKAVTKDVNAVKVYMALYNGKEKFLDLGEKAFSRGMSYSVLVYEGASGEPQASFVEAAIDTRR